MAIVNGRERERHKVPYGATLTVEYGVNAGNCSYRGHEFTGTHSVTVETNDMSQVLAVMLIIITIGLCADYLVFTRLERGMRRRWGFEAS